MGDQKRTCEWVPFSVRNGYIPPETEAEKRYVKEHGVKPAPGYEHNFQINGAKFDHVISAPKRIPDIEYPGPERRGSHSGSWPRSVVWSDEQRESHPSTEAFKRSVQKDAHEATVEFFMQTTWKTRAEIEEMLKPSPEPREVKVKQVDWAADLNKLCQKVNAPSVEQLTYKAAEKVAADRERKIQEALASGQHYVLFRGPHGTELIDLKWLRKGEPRDEFEQWLNSLEPPLTDEQKADAAERVCTTPFRERPVDEPVKEKLFPVHFYLGWME